MNIFIAGSGRVGFHLARLLSTESHDVTVIEDQASQVEMVDYALDVRTVEGDCVSVMLLQELNVGAADLFISATGSDEVNLIAAATAKGLGAKQVVARVDNPVYVEGTILYETTFGIDFILSPEALTALEIVRYLEEPGILSTEEFGHGHVQILQMRVGKTTTDEGRKLKDIEVPPGVLVGLICREGLTMIPHGDSSIQSGDLVALIGTPKGIMEARKLFQGDEEAPENVVIMGGSTIGLHLAQMLENNARSVKLFDWDMATCTELAGKLKRAKVVCRDGASRHSLESEHVDRADVFISATSDDERNIMAGVLAKEVGAKRTIAVVHQPDFAPLVRRLGIDHAATPRASIANRILKLVHQKDITSLTIMQEGQIEILEFVLTGKASVMGKTLKDVRFPRGALVASILRGEHVIVPRGDDEFRAGDSVIVITSPDSLDAVKKLF
jgi:trk/ktr system potassium uptake protein